MLGKFALTLLFIYAGAPAPASAEADLGQSIAGLFQAACQNPGYEYQADPLPYPLPGPGGFEVETAPSGMIPSMADRHGIWEIRDANQTTVLTLVIWVAEDANGPYSAGCNLRTATGIDPNEILQGMSALGAIDIQTTSIIWREDFTGLLFSKATPYANHVIALTFAPRDKDKGVLIIESHELVAR